MNNTRKQAFELFLISFVALFFEILYIRWLGSEVRIFAYFKNAVLVVCFLGLGMGMFLESRRGAFRWFLPLVAVTVVLVYIDQERLRLVIIPSGESISFWGFWKGTGLSEGTRKFFFIVIGFLALTVAAFIPLGQKMGALMKLHRPLAGYSINIAGSIAGVAAFSLLSMMSAPPMVWFAVGLGAVVYFYFEGDGGRGRAHAAVPAAAALGAAAIACFIYFRAEKATWSPYQKITMAPYVSTSVDGREKKAGYVLFVNTDFHQNALDLRAEAVRGYPDLEQLKRHYEAPMAAVRPRNALVVGSGMGNDVAAALRSGATRVDAVDIDPEIIRLGRLLHPERPYGDPRVRIFTDDARSFFTKSRRGTYDLIVFSLLDSHIVFSSHTSLRLDNFVYTIESFRQARRLLRPGGAISVSFIFLRPWMKSRFHNMLTEVFGRPPTMIDESTFLIGRSPDFKPFPAPSPEALGGSPSAASADGTEKFDAKVIPTTDDWPFLYCREKRLPETYWYVLGMIALLCAVFIFTISPGAMRRVDLHFFFLGVAFMLIEVRSISQLALLFGSTWIVNSLVIVCVLCMILAANMIVHLKPSIPHILAYAPLWAMLLVVYFFPMGVFLEMSFAARAALATLMLTLPLFFAGIIFAVSFSKTSDIPTALASNMLGVVIGGLFEYSSFVFGLRALSLFSLAFYALSFIPLLARGKNLPGN